MVNPFTNPFSEEANGMCERDAHKHSLRQPGWW